MIAIIFGIIMGIVHYFSKNILNRFQKYHDELVSFSAGIALTYIFLSLLPKFSKGVSNSHNILFLSILLGFVIFHIIEKYIYQNVPRSERFKELAIEDSIISFMYHFIIGIIMVSFFNKGLIQGLLFFIPVVLYTGVDTLPVDMTKSKFIKFVLSFSTLLGILLATFFYTEINTIVYSLLLGFIIGALSFTVTRHSIPQGKKGKPLFFIVGVIVYSALILLL